MTTLWEKFTKAIRWAFDGEAAAVATIQAAPAPQPRKELMLGAADESVAPPATAEAGVSIAGLRTINLYWSVTASGTNTFKLWLADGAGEWFPLEEVTVDGERGVLPPLDTEGWSRIAASCVGAELSGIFKIFIFPYNDEAS